MINYWFPTGIYHSLYSKHSELKTQILPLIPDQPASSVSRQGFAWPFWNKLKQLGPTNPLAVPNIEIQNFSNWVENEVTQFSRHYNSSACYKIDQCWANVYHQGDFQEPHIHPRFDFSAVYFLSIPANSGNLIFENSLAMSDMRPIKTSQETELNSTTAVYVPVEGHLVVFRSNLRHAVHPHNNTEPRISLALNLIEQ
jgi:uncharacterized protein (TIGR02466 family)